jgi:hypothetical protein
MLILDNLIVKYVKFNANFHAKDNFKTINLNILIYHFLPMVRVYE